MGGKSETTTSNSAPWAEAQPYLKAGLSDAQKLYSQGIGGQTYTGSAVVPMSKQTTEANRNTEWLANNAFAPLQNNFRTVAATTQDGGLNDLQRMSVDRLKPMAQGEMMNGNPYLDEMIAKNARDMGDAINLSASGAGRYGSGAHQDLLARNIGDMATTARANNYNTERGYMQDAISSLFSAGQQQRQNIYGGADAMTNAFGAAMAPAEALSGVGAQYEDLYGRQLQDQIRLFEASQNAPWEQLARMNAIASGSGSLGGSSTSVSRSDQGAGGVLGGLLGVLGRMKF